MQLLDRREFTYEPLHPPLARLAVALGPYLAGYRSQNGGDIWIEGRRILYAQTGHPDRKLLSLARLGILPFFVLCLAVTWRWAERHLDPPSGSIAAIMLASLPIFLGHAGLATTDVVFAAAFLLGFLSFVSWLKSPSISRGLALGIAVALAVTAKLSSLLFLPAACGTVLVYRCIVERRAYHPTDIVRNWPSGIAAVGTFLATIWIVYGCKSDPFYGLFSLAQGIEALASFAEDGEPSFFLNQIRPHGSWAFFPVLILVKSPIPFLVAVGMGAVALLKSDRREWWRMAPLLGSVAIVVSVLPSPINIGLRHILPVFPLMAIVAGNGLSRLLGCPVTCVRTCIVAILVTWQVGVSAAAAPDYLAYFNELALGQPQRIAVNSDLDWGQDISRLSAALKERQVLRVHLAVHTSADLRKDDLPPFETMYPGEPTTGWIAISEEMRALYCAGYSWLNAYEPVAQIGKSILLYYVAGPAAEPGPPDLVRHFNWNVPQPCSASAH
jgi:4-amino-4-deoxy-L-arabinose transferase-like glycosyltransferase